MSDLSFVPVVIIVVAVAVVAVPLVVAKFLRNVEAGEIRLVSWLSGGTLIYRGP